MTPELVIDVGEQALKMVALISAPLLFSALIVGLIVGMFQAATSINEQTLSFIPKLIILVVALFVAGPWMLQLMINFTRRLYENIPNMIG
jgi:flagellar biosynthetic protein FliQ